METIHVGVSEFKTKALELFTAVSEGGEYVVTKHGEPIANVVPITKNIESSQGSLAHMLETSEDIVEFDSSTMWDVLK